MHLPKNRGLHPKIGMRKNEPGLEQYQSTFLVRWDQGRDCYPDLKYFVFA